MIIKDYEYLHFCLYLLVCCGIGLKLVGLGVLYAECQKSDDVNVISVDCMFELSQLTEFSILLFLHPFIFDYFMPAYRSVPEISGKRQVVIEGLHAVTWVFVFVFFGLGISLSERYFSVVILAPLLVLLIMYIENMHSKAIHNDSTDVSISLQKFVTKKVETVASNLLHDIKTPLQCILLQVLTAIRTQCFPISHPH